MEIKGALGLGTAGRNVGTALVPASQSFSDPKIMIMLVANTIVLLIVRIPASGQLQRKALRPRGWINKTFESGGGGGGVAVAGIRG